VAYSFQSFKPAVTHCGKAGWLLLLLSFSAATKWTNVQTNAEGEPGQDS